MGDPSWSTLNRNQARGQVHFEGHPRGLKERLVTVPASCGEGHDEAVHRPCAEAHAASMVLPIVRSHGLLVGGHLQCDPRRGVPQSGAGWQHRGPLGLFAVPASGLLLSRCLGLQGFPLRQHAWRHASSERHGNLPARSDLHQVGPSRRQPVACAGNSGRRRPSAVCAVPAVSCTPAARPAGGAAAPSGRTPAGDFSSLRSISDSSCDCGSRSGVGSAPEERRVERCEVDAVVMDQLRHEHRLVRLRCRRATGRPPCSRLVTTCSRVMPVGA